MMARLHKIKVVFYFTDGYEAYKSLMPKPVIQGKDGTHCIERNKCHQRHWFARFKRKFIVISKLIHMINIITTIFAGVHINKTLNSANIVC